MKTYRNYMITAFFLLSSLALFAQNKESKKFKETFNVRKDAVVELNASYADIEVNTWGKNQVQVEAYLEIEGLTKEEADEYFKAFKFEAMGNSRKVKIDVGGNNFGPINRDFVVFDTENFTFPDINIPEVDMTIPEVNFPDINIQIPEIDLEKYIMDLEGIQFDFDRYNKDGNNYFFRWKDSVKDLSIKNKKEWEKFKKSKEFKAWKSTMKKSREEAMKEIKEGLKEAQKEIEGIDLSSIINESLKAVELALEQVDLQEVINESLTEVNKSMKEIDREQLRKQLSEIRREFKKSFPSDRAATDELKNQFYKNKKVNIKKKILIKVPKGTTLDVNTRHCKLNLPTISASGKVSYGTFNAQGLKGGKLDILSAPVKIKNVENTTLNLKNVTDAKLVSVTNSVFNSDSGDLQIKELLSGNTISISFGDVHIEKMSPSLSNFVMSLNQSDAEINVSGFDKKIKFEASKSAIQHNKNDSSGKWITLIGNIKVVGTGAEIEITGNYSELLLKR